MPWNNPAPDKIVVEVLQSTHGQTFVTWPTNVAAGGDLPALPVGHTHARSRHWLMADRTVVLILPGAGNGVTRHTFDAVSATWNRRTKTLTSLVSHPSEPDTTFAITTSGTGCACTQGAAGNAGPISEPYKIQMINRNQPEFDWFQEVTP